MMSERVQEQLGEAGRASQAGEHERCLRLVRELSVGDAPLDPVARGWAWFYEYKSLFFLQRYDAAWQLLSGLPDCLTAKNRAYVSSIAAELAMRRGDVDAVLGWGRRCLELRETEGDRLGVAQAAQTVCALLGELDRAELGAPFARELFELGRRVGADRATIAGARFLLAAANRGRDPATCREVWSTLDALRSIHDDRFSGEAIELAAEIWNALFVSECLDDAERTKLTQERALLAASGRGDLAEVTRLLDEGTNVDARDAADRTGLLLAAFAGHLDVVRLLLARGADVDVENSQRRTALVLAADQGHAGVVEALLDAGADPDHPGIFEQTALIVAGWQGHVTVTRLLLERGANPSLTDVSGNTALTLTATEDQPEVVQVILSFGVDVDQSTAEGHTPLMKAAMEGRAGVVRVLLDACADPRRSDRHGMTAASWARQEGFAELAAQLERAAHQRSLN